ncbi:hypothetical protein H8699_08930 [Christensenellaceae bacterium NSJ-44]|uniref:BppU N-terminal domain-containing protein n=1 Tax=Luoshenia tenuis TaxID=2763654 RepID=A0A926HJ57_9FIRM|nr:BppU family phage baseplate upper protein [Luoshenia tenuis]MBC8529547.1 hypothetical protein [Luoshenia tenuis]
MEHVQKLTLDMGLRVTPPKLYAKQGDRDTRKINCEMVMDGMPYAPGEGVTALYALRKPDDTQVIENAQLSGSACSLTLSEQCLTVPGVCLCEVILYKGEAVLASATFELDVAPNVYDEDGVISSDDYGALVAATAEANTVTQEANSAAALANEKANLAGQKAAQAQEQAQAAQTQASAAQAAAAAANTAKTAADTAAQAANTAAQNAQTQADYAQQQGDAVADIIEQGGFASVGHKHDAADMTSGILPVARGGTGVASLSEMGFSNPNLLVNGGFDVWQELESYTFKGNSLVGYCADQWMFWSYGAGSEAATITRTEDGLRVQHNGYTGGTYVHQTFPDAEYSKKLAGKTVTLSFEATIASGSRIRAILRNSTQFGKFSGGSGTDITYKNINGDGTRQVYSVSGIVPDDVTDLCIGFNGASNYSTNDYTLHWVKLEVGGAATPYVPADYATELMRCMRYYWRPFTYLYTHHVPADRDSWYLLAGITFPVRMRVAPTTTIYEPHNVMIDEADYGGYKFGAEDWGAPNHIWVKGDSDRTNYERLKEWGVKVDGLTEFLIEDFGNTTPPDNDRWAYYFHAEFDARRYS